jgi:hypothetical protein
MRNKIRWQAALAGVLLAGLGCMQAEPTTPPAGARVPMPKIPPPPAPGQPSPPPPTNRTAWIAHNFDADVTGRTDEWFEVKTRKGNLYHIVPDEDFVKRRAIEGAGPGIVYSQVKVGQRLRLWLYYGVPISVADMLVGAKPVPPLKCRGAALWGVKINGNRWPMTDEIIDD